MLWHPQHRFDHLPASAAAGAAPISSSNGNLPCSCSSISVVIKLVLRPGRRTADESARAAHAHGVHGLPTHLDHTGALQAEVRGPSADLVHRSHWLLVYTDLSSAAIGHRLGFSEATNFTRFFTRDAGMSPGAFRRRTAV